MGNNWYQPWLTSATTQSPALLVTPPVATIHELIPTLDTHGVELLELPLEGKLPIKTVHEVLSRVGTSPVQPVRLVWIPQAERLAVAAANAILKTLEEAPSANRFLLSTAYPGRILPTIRSRCSIIRLPRKSSSASPGEAPHFDPKRKQDITAQEAHAIAADIQKHIAEKGITPELHRSLQRLRDYYKISALTPGNKLASDALLATLLND